MAANPIIAAIRAALSQIGVPYRFGAEDPGEAFDCSGLTRWALSKAGLDLPHQSTAQARTLPRIGRADLRPGDLVFFSYGRLGSGVVDHVGIYLGRGLMIDASGRNSPVDVGPVDWAHFVQGGSVYSRIPGAEAPPFERVQMIARRLGVAAEIELAPNKDPSVRARERARGKRERGLSRGDLAGILRGFGLPPNMFDNLIDQAVRNQWSAAQFEAELYSSDEFAEAFPGIFAPDGSLKMSPAEYLRLAYGDGGYQDIARQFGIRLDRKRIGALIGGNVSPDEWYERAEILREAKHNEIYRENWNRVLRALGRPELDRKDWFRFLAGHSDERIANLEEAASLVGAFDVRPREAMAAARQIGGGGEFVDMAELVEQVRQVMDVIEPELRAAGITAADIAVLEAGSDVKGIAPRLQQILRNRQALIRAASGGRVGSFAPPPEGL